MCKGLSFHGSGGAGGSASTVATADPAGMLGTGNASQLAGGISQALVTTAAGLTVAIPAMVSHRYFERRVDSLVVQLEAQATKLVDAMHSDMLKPS